LRPASLPDPSLIIFSSHGSELPLNSAILAEN
jgi:hypothetical protein